jgi:GT2 family glycosyltransferase
VTAPPFDVVIPTLGRPSLATLLESLGAAKVRPGAVLLVADARAARAVLDGVDVGGLEARLGELRATRPGPAAARNVGWRAARSEWVVFLDDDVVVPPGWGAALERDLARCGPDDDFFGDDVPVAGSQGRLEVPLPQDRRPTDWERNVKGLESARYATADMAYRRAALEEVGGFDERFARAYREDSDIALRIRSRGYSIAVGSRSVRHPVAPAGFWSSVARQAGNADDVLMRRLHGARWRDRAGAPRGRRARHLALTGAGLMGLAGLATRRRRAARVGLALWTAGTAELAWQRVAPGPRTPREVVNMVATSVVIPPAAAWYWLRGWVRAPRPPAGRAKLDRSAARRSDGASEDAA